MPPALPTATNAKQTPLDLGYKDFGRLAAALAIAAFVALALYGIVKAAIIAGPLVGPPVAHYVLDLLAALQWRVFFLATAAPLITCVGILGYTSLRYGPVVGAEKRRFATNTLGWTVFGGLTVGFVWSIFRVYRTSDHHAFPVLFGLIAAFFGLILLLVHLFENAAKRGKRT